MILNDIDGRPATPALGIRTTLDELLRRAALRRPHATALVDPPDRASFTGGEPRRLTYAEADRMVSAIAGRLRRMGLRTDAIVAVQTANTVESALTILGILRAGLVAMPLPLLWRRAEAVTALSRVGAHALIVSGRIGNVDHYDLAMQIAAEIFSVRYVCGYGEGAPDGVVSFDDLYKAEALDPLPALEDERAPEPGAHLAAITWDVTADGVVPVARNHAELIAGGLAVMLESRLAVDAVVLSPLALSSFAGLAIALVPWLLRGGTLALHQPFDPEIARAQLRSEDVDAVIVPGPLAAQLAQTWDLQSWDLQSWHLETGQLQTRHFEAEGATARERSRSVIAVWRAPEQLAHALPWPATPPLMIDVQIFGEAGLIAAARASDGRPAVTPFGVIHAPRPKDTEDAGGTDVAKGMLAVAEIAPTPSGTLALRGPMVPHAAFPPEVERSGLYYLKISPGGHVDTGYACDPGSETMVVIAPPPDIIGVGGYRFPRRTLEDLAACVDGGTLSVLPDELAGHRLLGSAEDRAAAQAALAQVGASPLLVGAFRERPQAA